MCVVVWSDLPDEKSIGTISRWGDFVTFDKMPGQPNKHRHNLLLTLFNRCIMKYIYAGSRPWPRILPKLPHSSRQTQTSLRGGKSGFHKIQNIHGGRGGNKRIEWKEEKHDKNVGVYAICVYKCCIWRHSQKTLPLTSFTCRAQTWQSPTRTGTQTHHIQGQGGRSSRSGWVS